MLLIVVVQLFILAGVGGICCYYGFQAGKRAERGMYKNKIRVKQVETVDND